MSRLSKRIARGDFNGDSSDEDEVAMAQMVMASSFQYMQMRHNQQQGGHVGSVSGWAFIRRDRAAANERIHSDYFSEDPLFGGKIFRQRFRMAKPLFERILAQLQQHDDYFVQKPDAIGTTGLSGIQKMIASMRMLAYGMPADSVDEYVKIEKSTVIELLMRFCRGVVEIFEPEYLRAPNEADVSRLLRVAEDHGFPGMLGSLDCMQLVQTIREPSDRKKAHFAGMQEAYRKDVERAFGVLQARFAIVKGPACF